MKTNIQRPSSFIITTLALGVLTGTATAGERSILRQSPAGLFQASGSVVVDEEAGSKSRSLQRSGPNHSVTTQGSTAKTANGHDHQRSVQSSRGRGTSVAKSVDYGNSRSKTKTVHGINGKSASREVNRSAEDGSYSKEITKTGPEGNQRGRTLQFGKK